MNAFEECRDKVERESIRILTPFIEAKSYRGRFVLNNKGALARRLQKTVGDLQFNPSLDPDRLCGVEVKAELENKHNNFFLESWSNRKWFTPGWMINLNTDLLFYHFLDTDALWVMSFPRLRRWAYHDRQIYRWPEKLQTKRPQPNDTWGYCVPIPVLAEQIEAKVYHPKALQRSNVYASPFPE